MIRSTLAEVAACLGLDAPANDTPFAGVSTDTRTLAPGNLFVALTSCPPREKRALPRR